MTLMHVWQGCVVVWMGLTEFKLWWLRRELRRLKKTGADAVVEGGGRT